MRALLLVVFAGALSLSACGDPTSSRVAFGDSVTFGYGGQPGGWVTVLSQERGEPIANYGIPTELVHDGRKRFGSPIGPLALSPWAEEILLLHGGNDAASSFLKAPCSARCHADDLDGVLDGIVADVAAIVDEARDNGKNVVLATYWHVNAEKCSSMNLDEQQTLLANGVIDLYDAKLIAMAAEKRLPVARLDKLGLESDAANFYDCIHPSDAGYRKVAGAWRDALAE